MKKLLFAIAALLVMTTASCGNFTEGASFIATEDGAAWVKLGIGINTNSNTAGRALYDDMAKIASERLEAAFFDGTNYYRASWPDGERGYIWVPTGVDYAALPNRAILFAGTENRILLAVGTAYTLDSNGSTPTTITAAAKLITFELVPLGSDMAAGSFHITAG